MLWYALLQIINLIFDVLRLSTRSAYDKDLEILILRRQLAILQRHNQRVVRPDRDDKFILAFLIKQFKHIKQMTTKQLRDVISIVQPETVLCWHRDLVRRKWTQKRSSSAGHPPTQTEIEQIVLRCVHENDWGYGKKVGELRKLGHQVSEQTIANILKRHSIPPLPKRKTSLSWQHLIMTHYKDQLLACDFFTAETLFSQTLYVFFFIEIGTHRVHFAGCTTHPTQAWVTQQARQLTWTLNDENTQMRFLIRDRDTKFSSSFDAVFQSENIDVIQHLSKHQKPMPSPSGGFALFATNVSTRSLSLIRHICLASCLSTLITTIHNDLTKVFPRKHRYHYPFKPMGEYGAKIF